MSDAVTFANNPFISLLARSVLSSRTLISAISSKYVAPLSGLSFPKEADVHMHWTRASFFFEL